MMEERSCENGGTEKMEEIMLPGFRFHPTDEELVGFYLKRKIQQRSLSIELIRQLDIYKYDPWDLSKLATTGEKEWYFYCPRDRKYRNSARPNRVTGAGFWKATGTDRPIYSSEGSKCIGLKKSLVFYKGRAAKGIKTDWMMHEFRLPSLSDLTVPSKRFIDKNIPANDSWAICRIFKKANSTAHRALSQSWVSPILPETPSNSSDLFTPLVLKCQSTSHNFCSASIQYGITTTSSSPLDHNIPCYNKAFQPAASSYNTPSQVSISSNEDLPNICRTFLPHGKTDHHDDQPSTNSSVDASSLLLNMSSSIFGDFGKSSETLDYGNGGMQDDQYSGFSAISLPLEIQEKEEVGHGDQAAAAAATICLTKDPNAQVQYFDDQWGGSSVRSSINGWPFMSLPLNMPDSWKSNFLCDSNSSEISTGFSTNKCYT